MASSLSGRAAAIPSDSPSLARRLVGVVRRPAPSLAEVVARPRWAAALALTTLVSAAAVAGFAYTPTGRTALADQWEAFAYLAGHELSDAGYGRARALAGYSGTYAALISLVGVAGASVAAAAAGYLAVGRRAASATFREAFAPFLAVSAHASVILALRQAVAAPLGLLRETASTGITVGSWFDGLDAASGLAQALGLLDLFIVWWAVVLGVGFALASGRRPKRVAAGLVGTYAGLALLAGLVFTVARGHA